MSDNFRANLIDYIRLLLARFAMRICGPEHLYWVDPPRWEAYMSVGESGSQITVVPAEIFDDIRAICDGDATDENCGRVMDWLYGSRIRVEE